MGYGVYLPGRWRRQPQRPTAINWNNPIALDLAFAWHGGVPRLGLFRGPQAIASSNLTFSVAAPFGRAAQCSAGQVNIEWANRDVLLTSNKSGTGDFTIVAYANPAASGAGASEHIAGSKNDAAGTPFAQGFLIAHQGGEGAYESGAFNFFTYNALAGESVARASGACTGKFHQWAGVRSGSSHNLYRDRSLLAQSTGTVVNISQANRYIAIGSRGNGTTQSFRDVVGYVYMFNRALSRNEIAELEAYPWQILSPVRPIIYSLPSTAPTLSAATVTSITATSAKPRVTVTFN